MLTACRICTLSRSLSSITTLPSDATYRRMIDAGVEIVTVPRTEPYGRVAVFIDIAGNRWDLLGPA